MFTEVAIEDLLREVRSHDFGADPVHEFGANRIDAITALDRAIRAAQAEQLAQIAALHSERTGVMSLGDGDPALSIIGEVGMARNISPSAAGTQVGLAIGLDRLPRVKALFAAGQISEQVVRAVVRESVSLDTDDFVVLDGEIASQLPGLTHKQAGQLTARAVIRIDADAARERAQRNRADQRVSMFPDSDGVAILQVRGPAEQILATHSALADHARTLRASGDQRTAGQIMTQTLVERVTGQRYAEDVNVEVQLVMDAPTLLGQDGEPVDLVGYGPVSPSVADDIIAGAPNASIRRLLVDPVDGTLKVRENRARYFDAATSGHIRARDRRCRQPGNGAIAKERIAAMEDLKIRHNDHIHAHVMGGPSTTDNGQGLCIRSHTLKHLPGWVVTTHDKATIWKTPTGHTYRSDPPPLLPRDAPGHLRQ
jgi:hypothetical protein